MPAGEHGRRRRCCRRRPGRRRRARPGAASRSVCPVCLLIAYQHAVVAQLEDVVAVDHGRELEQRVLVAHPQLSERRVQARPGPGRSACGPWCSRRTARRSDRDRGPEARAWARARSARGGGRCCRCGGARRGSPPSAAAASRTHEPRPGPGGPRLERGSRRPMRSLTRVRRRRSGGELAGGWGEEARGGGGHAASRRTRGRRRDTGSCCSGSGGDRAALSAGLASGRACARSGGRGSARAATGMR